MSLFCDGLTNNFVENRSGRLEVCVWQAIPEIDQPNLLSFRQSTCFKTAYSGIPSFSLRHLNYFTLPVLAQLHVQIWRSRLNLAPVKLHD